MTSFSCSYRFVLYCGVFALSMGQAVQALAHDQSRVAFEASRRVALAKAKEQAETPGEEDTSPPTAELHLQLSAADGGRPLAGLVRITSVASGKAIELDDAIHRELNWYSVPPQSTLTVPQAKLRIEAFHGIQSELVSQEIDLTEKKHGQVELELPLFYDPHKRNEVGGNTHLHLMKLSYEGAVQYLETVPRSDGLDLVFLSHLRRIPDERTYISNVIVESSFENDGGELERLSRDGVLFGNGEEHRHNFDRHNEGYGHVMLLKLKKLILPVSIGSGIMREGTDGIPVQSGICEARDEGATVIWCHGKYGMEDVPNWLAGLLHAQNIFDGGSTGDYADSFYKYLDLGLRVPFSTGTDWFIYDFSRVYVPIEGEPSVDKWLKQLAVGRSYITNGTFLEFEVGDHKIGDTISLDSEATLPVKGRAVGRNDFGSLELVSGGEVIHAVKSNKVGNNFEADLNLDLTLSKPGWLALRIPRNVAKNELDKELFAHTSPIYVEVAGRRILRPEVAEELIHEVENNMAKISSLGVFNTGEEQTVLAVHEEAISSLKRLVQQHIEDSN